jgi:hypothetical protein
MTVASNLAVAATTAFTVALDAAAQDQTILLGDFVFDGWEVPEKITWGGAQRVNVHKMIGGERVIDSMGPDNADISWSGIFLSPDASLRADQLDQMRKNGELLDLVFAGRYYSVVISSFQADQRMLSYVPYNITLAVQRDQSIATFPFVDDAIAAVLGDVIAALSFVDASPLEMIATFATMADIPPMLALPALVIGSTATSGVQSALSSSQNSIGSAAAEATAAIGNMATSSVAAGNLSGATTVVTAVPAMQSALTVSQTAAVAAASGAYIGRASATAGRV